MKILRYFLSFFSLRKIVDDDEKMLLRCISEIFFSACIGEIFGTEFDFPHFHAHFPATCIDHTNDFFSLCLKHRVGVCLPNCCKKFFCIEI